MAQEKSGPKNDHDALWRARPGTRDRGEKSAAKEQIGKQAALAVASTWIKENKNPFKAN
jgi:hypothetical protein